MVNGDVAVYDAIHKSNGLLFDWVALVERKHVVGDEMLDFLDLMMSIGYIFLSMGTALGGKISHLTVPGSKSYATNKYITRKYSQIYGLRTYSTADVTRHFYTKLCPPFSLASHDSVSVVIGYTSTFVNKEFGKKLRYSDSYCVRIVVSNEVQVAGRA